MATGAEDNFEGMQSGVQSAGGWNSLILWLIILSGLVVMIILIIHWRKENGAFGSETDKDEIDDLNLDEAELSLLDKLADRVSATPAQLVRDKKVFEYAVHDYLSEVTDFFPRPALRCEEVANLRRSLDYVQHDSPIVYSTRGVHVGDTMHLNEANETDSDPAEARVKRVGEDFLEVEVDRKFLVGDEILAIAFVGAGRYSFKSRIARVSEDGGRCLVEHTTDLRRCERRSSRRVEAEGTIYCRPSQRPDAEWEEMAAVDLSEGGVRLHGGRITVRGGGENAPELDAREMEVRFLPEDLFRGDVEVEEMSHWLLTSARVVDVRHLGVDDYEYRLSFIDVDRPLERRLSRILYVLETHGNV